MSSGGAPWTDPDRSDERLDAAYQARIVPSEPREDRRKWMQSVPIASSGRDADLADAIGIDDPPPERKRHGRRFATPCDAALHYVQTMGFRAFPCRPGDKHPLTTNGFYDASNDPDRIKFWWREHPNALIGWWPGPSDIAVLDIDQKNGKDGLATLARLDTPILPATPTVLTPSNGMHLHHRMPQARIGMTTGEQGQGIGEGLDWRADKGYVILPSPDSGYRWGRWHYGNCAPVSVPASLMPRSPPSRAFVKPIKLIAGLSRYAEAALDGAERAILGATAGSQEITLVRECFSIATLAAAGGVPQDFALAVLHDIGSRLPDLDPQRRWSARELHRKVERSFIAGLQTPRGARHG